MFLGFFGIVLLAGVVIGWYWLHRRIKGDEGPLLGRLSKDQNKDSSAELEAFIAAYRSGKLNAAELQQGSEPRPAPERSVPSPIAPNPIASSPVGPRAVSQATPMPSTATAAAAATEAEPASTALLRPEVKLAYLTLRAGLRDHHVFPSIRLSDMGRGAAPGKVDLLVCNAQFQLIAAIDVFGAGSQPDAEKMAFLREAGIRYLKFSIGSMPKPAAVRALLYRT
jgi:hypothetical protein